MTTYPCSIAPSAFILGDDGMYVGTVLGTTHGLGTSFCVTKMHHRNNDMTFENLVLPYKIESNGDLKVFVTEPTLVRLVLVSDA